jgi:integrase
MERIWEMAMASAEPAAGAAERKSRGADRARLTDVVVRDLPAPASGSRITYDGGQGRVRGFGCRVTANGIRAFILNYTIAGRERRMTIGEYPTWRVATARREAERLRREIDMGTDPLGEKLADRAAPTVNELADRYLEEHAVKKRTGAGDEAMIRRVVKPALGARKAASISFGDIDRLHRAVTKAGTPIAANRVLALLSKMFSLAIRWGMRIDNPCRGVERNHEEKRNRYLSGDELRRLTEALAAHPGQAAANAVRLLLLTGARRGEVLGATWGQFDLESGIWTKPSSHTKQKREHRVPLSAPARQLLATMKAEAGREPSPYLFPAWPGGGEHLTEIRRSWESICKAAGISGVRLHDLRHTYASVLASSGLSLPIIGALLGHTQPNTTARYSHLFDDPLRAAAERAGAVITGKGGGAEVVPIAERGRR